jgi:hypothetical protein
MDVRAIRRRKIIIIDELLVSQNIMRQQEQHIEFHMWFKGCAPAS